MVSTTSCMYNEHNWKYFVLLKHLSNKYITQRHAYSSDKGALPHRTSRNFQNQNNGHKTT
jgi:hypothetical protein